MSPNCLCISHDAYAALLRLSHLSENGARKRSDGQWEIPAHPAYVAEVFRQRVEGETVSDTILRLCAKYSGQVH